MAGILLKMAKNWHLAQKVPLSTISTRISNGIHACLHPLGLQHFHNTFRQISIFKISCNIALVHAPMLLLYSFSKLICTHFECILYVIYIVMKNLKLKKKMTNLTGYLP